MFMSRTAEADRRQRVVDVRGQKYILREYVGSAPRHGRYIAGNEANGNSNPQGFLVYQPPHSVTPPHFHETNQFQVFVDGGAKLGKQAANPLSVHYAGGHTPYGPIAAGEQGVRYFTLRQRWDAGAKYMPEMRDYLDSGRQRHRLHEGLRVSSLDERTARAQTEHEVIFPLEDDGLFAAMLRVAPDAQFVASPAGEGGGLYIVVVSGELRVGERGFELWSCLYQEPDEPMMAGQAGPEGVEFLLLQFPRLASADSTGE